jgi:hypothetical protein
MMRMVALSVLAGLGALAGDPAPAKADVTILRCTGGPPLMAALDLEQRVFYLRQPFFKAWNVRVYGERVYIPRVGQLSLTTGLLQWGENIYQCSMSPS